MRNEEELITHITVDAASVGSVNLSNHFVRWQECEKCNIGSYAKRHVLGKGRLPCDVLVLGEGPGDLEDRTGEPFNGKGGMLINDLLKKSTPEGLDIKFFMTNTIACKACDYRGGTIRKATTEEISNCAPRIEEIFELAKPKRVVCVGKVAMHAFLDIYSKNPSIAAVPMLSIYHPGYFFQSARDGEGISHKFFDDTVKRLRDFFGGLADVEKAE